MKPVSFTYTGAISSPVQEVFELITDVARMPDWLPGCRTVTPGSRPARKGTRHRLQFQRSGRRVDAEIEVIEYTPPTGYGWVETRGREGAKTFFGLQFQGATTRVAMKYVFTPVGWRAWLKAQVYRRRHAHEMFDRLLQNLRKTLMHGKETRR
jgi:uncharacterized protein YndB with AHSA1/START domain